MQAKYELLNRGGALQFEYDTAHFSDVGGLKRLKQWLTQRKAVFRGDTSAAHAKQEVLATQHILDEVQQTRPLSVVMHEQIDALRRWAYGRTVSCD